MGSFGLSVHRPERQDQRYRGSEDNTVYTSHDKTTYNDCILYVHQHVPVPMQCILLIDQCDIYAACHVPVWTTCYDDDTELLFSHPMTHFRTLDLLPHLGRQPNALFPP